MSGEHNDDDHKHDDHHDDKHDDHHDDKHEDHHDDEHEGHEHCNHDHEHEGHEHCNHDHHEHGGPEKKRKRGQKQRKRDHENDTPYQPPPPPELHPPQREPLMIDPLPKWDVPVSKVLEDGKVDCVSTDPGKVLKTIIKPGVDNKQMHVNTRTRLHFVGTFDDGTKFGSSRDKNEEFVYLYGKHEVIPGFDAALSTMRNGEIADVVIQPDYAYGDKTFDNIPPNSVLHFNIELISYEWEPIEPMDQIEYAGEKKEEGNEKVKQGKWQEAIDTYQKGYNFVEVLMIGDPGQHKLGQEMKLAVALNKAHCHIQLSQFEDGLKMCNDALKVEPASAKGKFRRGLCYMGLGDYYRAESDFRSALVSQPNDKAILQNLAKLRQILDPIEKAQAAKFKEKNKGKNIFEQMKVEEKKEEIARKERELKRIEEEKEQAERKRIEEEKERELKRIEEENKKAEKKEDENSPGTEKKKDDESGIAKEAEVEKNGAAAAVVAGVESSGSSSSSSSTGGGLVKEEEKDK